MEIDGSRVHFFEHTRLLLVWWGMVVVDLPWKDAARWSQESRGKRCWVSPSRSRCVPNEVLQSYELQMGLSENIWTCGIKYHKMLCCGHFMSFYGIMMIMIMAIIIDLFGIPGALYFQTSRRRAEKGINFRLRQRGYQLHQCWLLHALWEEGKFGCMQGLRHVGHWWKMDKDGMSREIQTWHLETSDVRDLMTLHEVGMWSHCPRFSLPRRCFPARPSRSSKLILQTVALGQRLFCCAGYGPSWPIGRLSQINWIRCKFKLNSP